MKTKEIKKEIKDTLLLYAVSGEKRLDNCVDDLFQLLKEKETQTRQQVVEEIEKMLKPEWIDPDVEGTSWKDYKTDPILTPLIRNGLREEILHSLKERQENSMLPKHNKKQTFNIKKINKLKEKVKKSLLERGVR